MSVHEACKAWRADAECRRQSWLLYYLSITARKYVGSAVVHRRKTAPPNKGLRLAVAARGMSRISWKPEAGGHCGLQGRGCREAAVRAEGGGTHAAAAADADILRLAAACGRARPALQTAQAGVGVHNYAERPCRVVRLPEHMQPADDASWQRVPLVAAKWFLSQTPAIHGNDQHSCITPGLEGNCGLQTILQHTILLSFNHDNVGDSHNVSRPLPAGESSACSAAGAACAAALG